MWVMCAEESLDSATILEAIRIDSTKETLELASTITEDSLLSMCSNLLVIDSASGTWKVSHLSVAEYFERSHWSMQKAHLHVVKSCLLLLLEAFASDEHVAHVAEYSQAEKGGLLGYAVRRWPEHARTQEGEDQSAFQSMIPLVKRFLGYSTEGSTYFQKYFAHLHAYVTNKSLVTPLYIICFYGLHDTLGDWWECIEIDHWEGNPGTESPLTFAAMSNSVPLCRKLIQRGEIINTQDNGDYGSALAAAASYGNLEVVKFLCLDAGANVNLLLDNGDGSALAAASSYDNLEVVKFLCLDAGADVNLLLNCGPFGSALAAAAFHDHLEIVKFLLDAGANMDLPLKDGRYGMFEIAKYHQYLETVSAESNLGRPHDPQTLP